MASAHALSPSSQRLPPVPHWPGPPEGCSPSSNLARVAPTMAPSCHTELSAQTGSGDRREAPADSATEVPSSSTVQGCCKEPAHLGPFPPSIDLSASPRAAACSVHPASTPSATCSPPCRVPRAGSTQPLAGAEHLPQAQPIGGNSNTGGESALHGGGAAGWRRGHLCLVGGSCLVGGAVWKKAVSRSGGGRVLRIPFDPAMPDACPIPGFFVI